MALLGSSAAATAVPVVISPVPKLQFFDASGVPLAFGCVFSYISGTTTQLPTYTDATGTVQNSNPIILDAGGFAGSGASGIWLSAGQAYTLKVSAAGGTNCALGATLYTIDGIGGGLTLLTTNVVCASTCSFAIQSQNQLFEVSLTGNAVANPLTAVGIIPPAYVVFQITEDSSGGHTFTWPANSVGGCPIGTTANQVTTQMFIWNGSNATAIGPCVTGNGPNISAGVVTALQYISTIATGTPPLVVASTTKVVNLNVDQVDGCDWAIPCPIGSTTPNTGAFTTLQANTSFVLNGSTPQTGVQGSDTKILSAGTVSGTGAPLCLDANGGATTSSCSGGGINAPQAISLAAPVGINANSQTTILTKSVTFPSATGNYRADIRSAVWITAGPNACATEVVDVTNTRVFASANAQNANGSGFIGIVGTEISTSTYAAGATVTFHLDAICNAASTATVNWALGTASFSPAEASFLQITPIPSN